MSKDASGSEPSVHIGLFPSAGMGHLRPFLRLAAMLSSRNCLVTLISAKPTVSEAESTHITSFIAVHPQIKHLELNIIPIVSADPSTDDPFFLQFKAVSQSAHLLRPLLLSASPPLSGIFYDLLLASSIAPMAHDLCIPNYIVSTTSAQFLSLMAYLPHLASSPEIFSPGCTQVRIPGLNPFHASSIPPPFWNKCHLFTSHIIKNARFISEADGVIINTFTGFEPDTLDALGNGRVLERFPQVLPVGPYRSYTVDDNSRQTQLYLQWLDKQPARSVVYLSFGSRTTMNEDQIRELGHGLDSGNHRFLWVLKTSKVDKEDSGDVADLLGVSLLERLSSKGIIVRSWVNQDEILAHASIGGFVNHCGWNSVSEAAWQGVPILAWPQHGDQKLNAGVVENAGLGIWERSWGWGGEKLVTGLEIRDGIQMLMEDERLKTSARKVGEEAQKACGFGGSSYTVWTALLDKLRTKTQK